MTTKTLNRFRRFSHFNWKALSPGGGGEARPIYLGAWFELSSRVRKYFRFGAGIRGAQFGGGARLQGKASLVNPASRDWVWTRGQWEAGSES